MPRRKSKTATITCKAAATAQRCVDLRLAGKSFPAIAAEVGCSTSTAHKAVSDWLERTRKDTAQDAVAVLTLEIERLDTMLAALWPAATAGDCQAVDRCLRIMERRAKLLGLDAPDRHRLEAAKVDMGGEPMPVDQARELLAQRLQALSGAEVAQVASGDEDALNKLGIQIPRTPRIFLPPLAED